MKQAPEGEVNFLYSSGDNWKEKTVQLYGAEMERGDLHSAHLCTISHFKSTLKNSYIGLACGSMKELV